MAKHAKLSKITYGDFGLTLHSHQGNYLYRKHFDLYFDELAQSGASWIPENMAVREVGRRAFAWFRNVRNVISHYFTKNFNRISLTGHTYFHGSKVNEDDLFIIHEGHTEDASLHNTLGYKPSKRMDVCLGLDCGALHKTPLTVTSALVIILQLSNLLFCQNSLYNALPICLSYKKDSTLEGRELVHKICNDVGKRGTIEFDWFNNDNSDNNSDNSSDNNDNSDNNSDSNENKVHVWMDYQAHAQGDHMAKNESINVSSTVRSRYGGTQGYMWDPIMQKKRGMAWYSDYTTSRLMNYVPPDEVPSVMRNERILKRYESEIETLRRWEREKMNENNDNDNNNSNNNDNNNSNDNDNNNSNDNDNNNGNDDAITTQGMNNKDDVIVIDDSDIEMIEDDNNNNDNNKNDNNKNDDNLTNHWWSLTDPELGNKWGRQTEQAWRKWVVNYYQTNGHFPDLTESEANSIRGTLSAQLHHGIIREGHALSFGYMCEPKHIMWRIQLHGLACDTSIAYCVCGLSHRAMTWCLDVFKIKTINSQFDAYWKTNKKQNYDKQIAYRLIGNDIDTVTLVNPEFLYRVDYKIVELFDIDRTQQFNENSDLNEIDNCYLLQTWWLAVNWRVKELYQKFFWILHIPRFDDDNNDNHNNDNNNNDVKRIPELLEESLRLSIQIWDLIERFQSYSVCALRLSNI